MKQHIFVTAPPGVGKSTLIQRVLEQLQLLPAGTCGMHSSSSGRSTVPGDSSAPIATGFYTEEVRVGGERVGFDIVTLTGQRGPLARAGTAGRVRYSLDGSAATPGRLAVHLHWPQIRPRITSAHEVDQPLETRMFMWCHSWQHAMPLDPQPLLACAGCSNSWQVCCRRVLV